MWGHELPSWVDSCAVRSACAVWQTGFWFWLLTKRAEGGAVVAPSAHRAPSPGRCAPTTAVVECVRSCLCVRLFV